MNKPRMLHFGIGEGFGDLVRDAFWYEQRFNWAKKVLRCLQGITARQIDMILKGDVQLVPIEDYSGVEMVFEEDKKFKEELAKHMNFVKERIVSLHKELYELERMRDMRFNYDETAGSKFVKLGNKIIVWEEELRYYDKLFKKKIEPKLTINIAGIEIPQNLLEEYAGDVVKRLRLAIKNPELRLVGDTMELLELEERRQLLHNRILDAAGFTKGKRKSDKYFEFSKALEKFLEEMGAGLFERER